MLVRILLYFDPVKRNVIGISIGDSLSEEDSTPYSGNAYQIHNGNGPLEHHAIPVYLEHANGMTEYELHNTYGHHEAHFTNNVLRQLYPGKRPFILTRSTWVSTGRFSAHWLGDNFATWEQMWLSLQGLLQFQLYGIPMVGADVCGL